MTSLPHGDVGRIINSFVSGQHQDAVQWQRDFRQRLYIKRKSLSFLEQLRGIVYLVATKHLNLKYLHIIRLPDCRRILASINLIPSEERVIVAMGGVPPSWYPQTILPTLVRCFRRFPVGTNNYIVENPDPLPWEYCCNVCCRSNIGHKARIKHRAARNRRLDALRRALHSH